MRRILSTGLILLLGAAAARADVILLRNGSMLQGTIIEERTDDEAIHIRLYRDNAVLRVLWDHVLGRDADRLRGALGFELDDGDRELLIVGHMLTMKNGSTYVGLIEKEDSRTIFFRRQSAGRIAQEIPVSSVAKKEEVEVDIREVYVTDEIVEIKEREATEAAGGDLAALDPEAREDLASYLMKVGAYDAARNHFNAIIEADAAPNQLAARNKLKNLEILARSKEAGDLMNEVKRLSFIKRYAQAMEVLAQFEEKFGDKEKVRELHRFDSVKKRTEKALREQRITDIKLEWMRVMGSLIRKATSDRDKSMKDLTSWATRSLTKDIIAAVAEKVGVEPNEVRGYWDARTKRHAHTASYGYGSFAAPEELAKAKARERAARASSRGDRTRAGANRNKAKEKKPKTPDQWWDGASSRDRRNWLTAYYVENADAGFEIVRVIHDSCRTCAGRGYKIEQSAADGGETRLRCETCNGHGEIRKLRYR